MPFDVPKRSSLVVGLKSATIIIAALAIFYQDLYVIACDALQTESMSHILAVPLLLAYLIYRKRKLLGAMISLDTQDQPKAIVHLPAIAGTILSATAILVYWHGSYTFMPLQYHMLSLPIFTAGLTLVLFNIQTLRQLAFPIAFLIFLTPPPSEILYGLGSTLSVLSSEASFLIISSLGIPSILTSEYGNPVIQITQLNGETTRFAVDIACSGIYSMIGFLIFSMFIAYMVRDKLWKKLALFLIGFSLVYVVNVTRIITTLLIGYYHGEEIALQLFHMLGGWILIFLGTLSLLIMSEKIFRMQLFAKRIKECSVCNSDLGFCLACGRILRQASVRLDKTTIIKTAAIIVSVVLLTSIQVPVFALTEGPAQIIIQTPVGEQGNTELLPHIPNYTLRFVYRDRSFEEFSGQDASLVYVYSPINNTENPIWVTVEIGSSTSRIHNWEVCLISIRMKLGLSTLVNQLDLKDIQIQENPPIIARCFAFYWIETKKTQVILYWYETSRFMENSTPQEKRVKISLMIYPETPQNISEVESQLVPHASAIANHWQPIKEWSQVALLLSQKGAYFATVMGILLILLMIPYAFAARRQRKANARAYTKLSEENRSIIDAIHSTKTIRIVSKIAATYEKLQQKPISVDMLMKKLKQAQEIGLVKQEIINVQDEPVLGWKTQM